MKATDERQEDTGGFLLQQTGFYAYLQGLGKQVVGGTPQQDARFG